MHTSVISAVAAKAGAARYLTCLRLQEVLVLQGSPLLGCAMSSARSRSAGAQLATLDDRTADEIPAYNERGLPR
jgi:hypothetical protein